MTYDDDFIRIGGKVYPCKVIGLDWPPPKLIMVEGGVLLEMVSCSEITDEERARMTHVCRGAEYKVFHDYTHFTGRH